MATSPCSSVCFWKVSGCPHPAGVKPDHLAHVERFFKRYGGGIVIAARFIVILRQLNGVVAGSIQMPWWRFLTFNALGAALWVGFWGGGAFFLGEHFAQIENGFSEALQIQPDIRALYRFAFILKLA